MRWWGVAAVLAAAIVALAAQPGARAADDALAMTVPETWRELPELVAASGAASPGVRVVARRGWGDPVSGCFFVAQIVETERKGTAAAAYAAVATGLRAAGLEVSDPAVADDGSEARMSISGDGFQGVAAVFAAAGEGGIVRARSAACLYNQREPERSRELCDEQVKRFGGRS